MKEPEYWKPTDQRNQPPESLASKGLPERIKIIACLLFLIVSGVLWLSIDSTFGRVIYWILFFIPSWFCGEWLFGKIFNDEAGRSISSEGFSLVRIIFGVLFVLAVFGFIYSLAALGKWLM